MADVDLSKLRAKYGPIAEKEQARAEAEGRGVGPAPAPTYPEFKPFDPETAAAAVAAEDGPDDKAGVGLESLIMCMDCHGSGTRQEQYNHMLIDRTCPRCDGDGLVLKEGVDAAAARTKRQQEREEAEAAAREEKLVADSSIGGDEAAVSAATSETEVLATT